MFKCKILFVIHLPKRKEKSYAAGTNEEQCFSGKKNNL